MKIIITGGTGFIGSAVLDRLLARDHDVIALVRSDQAAAAWPAAGPLRSSATSPTRIG
jgi:uncharacterized protein YbjT (DUF2867 family)